MKYKFDPETESYGSPDGRRLLHDDSRGVDEALNEMVCVQDECTGLTVRLLLNPVVIVFAVAAMLLTPI